MINAPTPKQPSGFLNIDKPEGITSHDVIDQLRKTTGIRKIGHAGTLDPFATGVLVIGIGQATRLLEFIESQTKTYLAEIKLGETSDTYDRTGQITPTPNFQTKPTKSDIKKILENFRGRMKQTPPLYSAIKIKGQRLYKIARKQSTDQKATQKIPAREVEIKELALETYKFPTLKIRTTVGKGTYIRSLAHDIGQALQTGALLKELRRESVGAFTLKDAAPLASLTKSNWQDYLFPPKTAVKNLPAIKLTPTEATKIKNGQKIPHPKATALDPNQPAALFDQSDCLIAIAHTPDNQTLKPDKVLA